MSYSESASPGTGGYSNSAYPKINYSPTSDDKTGTFMELSPYKDYAETIEGGVGPFHFNHFIGYFKPPKRKVSTIDFFAHFPLVFNAEGNVASAVTSEGYKFKGHDTVKFLHANPIKAYGHEDWVTLQMAEDNLSFFARTLKREWVYTKEAAANALLKRNLDIKLPIEANQRHFLAGRRSWAVGYLPASKLNYIETAAFERFSHPFYHDHEYALSIKAETIVDIWVKLIKDYADYYEVELISNDGIKQIFRNYKTDYWYFSQPTSLLPFKPGKLQVIKDVYYAHEDRPTAAEAHAVPWFKEVLKRHPGLLS